jgi:hypothetical protein
MKLSVRLVQPIILVAIVSSANALVSWNFGEQACSAVHDLNAEDYMEQPITILDWYSKHCWTNGVVPNSLDDVQIICDENCGRTGPIAIQISLNATIKSLNILTSTPTKYVSLQITSLAMLSILGTFNATTGPSSFFSLQVFPTSHLLLHDSAKLDGSVFNGGSISAPRERVSVLVFYVEMCGYENPSLINVDLVSIMGAKASFAHVLKRSSLLQITDSEIETFVPAVTNDPLEESFWNRGACHDAQLFFFRSSVPGIYFSGTNAKMINASVTVPSFSSYQSNSMLIFNHSFNSLFGQNCNIKSNSLIVFQNGPQATQALLMTCNWQSTEKNHIARAVQFQKETKFVGTSRPCSIFLVGAVLPIPNAVHGLVVIQDSLHILSCTITTTLLKSNYDSRFNMIVINQSEPNTMSLSITSMTVTRQGTNNKAPLTDVLFYSCSNTASIGTVKFGPSTSFTWSCATSLVAGARIEFSGNLFKFDSLEQSLVISDPLEKFNVVVSHLYESNVIFQGNAIQVAFGMFVMNSGKLSIGSNIMEASLHNVSCKSFAQSVFSSIILDRSGFFRAENVIMNGTSIIDGTLSAKTLVLKASSNTFGTGNVLIELDGQLVISNTTSSLTPSLTALRNATIPAVLHVIGAVHCDSCNVGNSTDRLLWLSSFTEICLHDLNLHQSITLIAPKISLQNFTQEYGIVNVIGEVTICSGRSILSALNFTNEFRIDAGSFLQVLSVLFVPLSSLFNVSGQFLGHFADVNGQLVIGTKSQSFIRSMVLRSSATLFNSGNLSLTAFSADCQACNIVGGGVLACLKHFEVIELSIITIDLSHVTFVGTFLQHHQSTIHITNMLLELNTSNATVLGVFYAINTTLIISNDSNVVLNNAFTSLSQSILRVLGHLFNFQSALVMDATSEFYFGPHSNYDMEMATMNVKQLNTSGKYFACRSSKILSNVAMFNDVSFSNCDVIGNVIVENRCVVTVPNTADWGFNVTGKFSFLGHFRILLNSSTKIGYSKCILMNDKLLDASVPIVLVGISKERVHMELEADCLKLTHKGCPPGREPSNESSCIQCNAGYFSNQYHSICERCPQGTYSQSNQSVECSACPAGKYCLEGCFTAEGDGWCPSGSYSTLKTGISHLCTPCPAGTYNENTGSTSPSACLNCPEGAFCLARSNSSFGSGFCSAETYSTSGSGVNASCLPCPRGRRCMPGCGSNNGSMPCDECKPGSFFHVGHKKCRLCSPGTFNNANTSTTSCNVCSLGWIAQDPGSHMCSQCPSGQTSNAERTSCTPCSLEWAAWSLNTNEANCSPCTLPKFVYDDLCIDPFHTGSSVLSTNISLHFPHLNVSLFNTTFITRYVCINTDHKQIN